MNSIERLRDLRAYDYFLHYQTPSKITQKKSELKTRVYMDFKKGILDIQEYRPARSERRND